MIWHEKEDKGVRYLKAPPSWSGPPAGIKISYAHYGACEPWQGHKFSKSETKLSFNKLEVARNLFYQWPRYRNSVMALYLCFGASSPSNLILNLMPIEWLFFRDSTYCSKGTMNSEGLVLSCQVNYKKEINFQQQRRINLLKDHNPLDLFFYLIIWFRD